DYRDKLHAILNNRGSWETTWENGGTTAGDSWHTKTDLFFVIRDVAAHHKTKLGCHIVSLHQELMNSFIAHIPGMDEDAINIMSHQYEMEKNIYDHTNTNILFDEYIFKFSKSQSRDLARVATILASGLYGTAFINTGIDGRITAHLFNIFNQAWDEVFGHSVYWDMIYFDEKYEELSITESIEIGDWIYGKMVYYVPRNYEEYSLVFRVPKRYTTFLITGAQVAFQLVDSSDLTTLLPGSAINLPSILPYYPTYTFDEIKTTSSIDPTKFTGFTTNFQWFFTHAVHPFGFP
ncbi:MAG: hypothetical protein ACTSUE_11640, partial [Promethearchaeota archaeon]